MEAVTLPSLGQSATALTEARDDEEWRKRLLAKLLTAPAALFIDNVRRRVDSGALPSALTAWPSWEDRLLGKSEIVTVPVRCLWLMSGNNPEWLRQAVTKDNDHEVQFANGSRALAFPTNAGDSYTGTLAIVDKADVIPDLSRLMRSVKPTIDGGGKMILLSRPDKFAPDSPFKRIGSPRGENWMETRVLALARATGTRCRLVRRDAGGGSPPHAQPRRDGRAVPGDG